MHRGAPTPRTPRAPRRPVCPPAAGPRLVQPHPVGHQRLLQHVHQPVLVPHPRAVWLHGCAAARGGRAARGRRPGVPSVAARAARLPPARSRPAKAAALASHWARPPCRATDLCLAAQRASCRPAHGPAPDVLPALLQHWCISSSSFPPPDLPRCRPAHRAQPDVLPALLGHRADPAGLEVVRARSRARRPAAGARRTGARPGLAAALRARRPRPRRPRPAVARLQASLLTRTSHSPAPPPHHPPHPTHYTGTPAR